MNKVLVLAVHPDDETLGCGGALLRHKESGSEINWLIITNIKKEYGFSKAQVERRQKEIKIIKDMYGFNNVFDLGFPPAKLAEAGSCRLVENISKVFKELKPNTIYLPFKSDIHSDHRITFEAAYIAAKTFRYNSVKRILMMETLSETEFSPALKDHAFIPNHFVDISMYLKKKLDIMRIYASEINAHPFPRSLKNIKALAVFRGAAINCKYAESFMILKDIVN